jgi:hypothetical protein
MRQADSAFEQHARLTKREPFVSSHAGLQSIHTGETKSDFIQSSCSGRAAVCDGSDAGIRASRHPGARCVRVLLSQSGRSEWRQANARCQVFSRLARVEGRVCVSRRRRLLLRRPLRLLRFCARRIPESSWPPPSPDVTAAAGQRRRGLRPRCATSLPAGVIAVASQNSATFLVRCRRPTKLANTLCSSIQIANGARDKAAVVGGGYPRRHHRCSASIRKREDVIGACRAACAEARASLKARDEIFDPAGRSSQQGVKRFLGFCTIWRNK